VRRRCRYALDGEVCEHRPRSAFNGWPCRRRALGRDRCALRRRA
jgi:hypothetical protein